MADLPLNDPARRYAGWRGSQPCLHEGVLLEVPPSFNEHQLQAHWFAGDFGRDFTTVDGSPVHIIQFGVWNQEAGPDFIEAAISLDGGPPLRGPIELDPDARDWERHGHAINPDYDTVLLHVFTRAPQSEFFSRTCSHRNVPQVLLDPGSLLSHIPNPVPVAKLGRCMAHLQALSPERLREILLAAAQFRLRRKAAALIRLGELHGPEEALFQAIATALGYKNNKLPFTLLAQRLPLRLLLREKAVLEGILFGVSGFLSGTLQEGTPTSTRTYLRQLWEQWWPHRARFECMAIAPGLWSTNGQRPLNHPQRRLAALAEVVRHWPRIRKLIQTGHPTQFATLLADLGNPFWEHHFTFDSKPTLKPMALIGQSRITELLANVFYPLAVTADPHCWNEYLRLPAVLTNRRLETAAIRFFGGSLQGNALLKTAAIQQGLLQLYEDFCMQDASDCMHCPFPEQLATW